MLKDKDNLMHFLSVRALWRRDKGQTIIFGHRASLEGMTDDPKVIGLDTGCVWGNAMTFYEL